MFIYAFNQQKFIEDQLHAQAVLAPGVAGRPMRIDALMRQTTEGVSGLTVIRFCPNLVILWGSTVLWDPPGMNLWAKRKIQK